MKISEAIKWIDNRMCRGRGQWTEHHQPIIDEPWQAGLMAIEALQNSQWIPCSERLPEEDGRYFVTRYDYVTESSFVDILWYEKHTWWNRRIVGDFAVKAWMPLPEPWKGADDERV